MVLIVQFSVQNYNFSYAEDENFPNWLFTLNSFWVDGKITDEELTNAIKFLQENDIIQLIFHKEYDTKTNFLLSILQIEKHDEFHALQFLACDSGWYITGYFVPVEADYNEKAINVMVNGQMKQYRTDFLDAVNTEGWGKTLDGNYLGWYDDSYHLENEPLDFFGNTLVPGTVAIDNTSCRNYSWIRTNYCTSMISQI